MVRIVCNLSPLWVDKSVFLLLGLQTTPLYIQHTHVSCINLNEWNRMAFTVKRGDILCSAGKLVNLKILAYSYIVDFLNEGISFCNFSLVTWKRWTERM